MHKLSWDSVASKRVTFSKAVASAERTVDTEWLSKVSEAYDISPNLYDYDFFEVPVVTSDIPNKNMEAIPRDELFKFNVNLGTIVYKGYVGRPVHIEHEDSNPRDAIGVVFDASVRYIEDYDIYKLVILLGVDVLKYPNIRTISEPKWSMGCLVTTFKCSVCGHESRTPLPDCYCSLSKGFGGIDEKSNRLIYKTLHDIIFVEVSLVRKPADITAVGVKLKDY